MSEPITADDRTSSLHADYDIAFPFTRTTGPIMGGFLGALKEGRLTGLRAPSGDIWCPPTEFDVDTGALYDDASLLVELQPTGTVTNWTWVPSRPGDPIDTDYAWALIAIDGARGTLMHRVDTGGDMSAMQVGMPVAARWAEERVGSVRDIVAFVPGPVEPAGPNTATPAEEADGDRLPSPVNMHYTYVPGGGLSGFLRGLARRRILARRCPSCEQVYAPAPEFCARCLVGLEAEQELTGRGTVVTFCIINFPFPGQSVKPPYAVARIQLHGADTRILHLVRETELADIEIGMEVEPVWSDADELEPSWMSITHFRPATSEETDRA